MNTSEPKFLSDCAVYFATEEKVVWAASCQPDGMIAIGKFPLTDNISEELKTWRSKLGLVTGDETVFRFVPSGYVEQTRRLSLADPSFLSDAELVEFLADALAKDKAGEDGKSLFPKGRLNVYDFTRQPDQSIVLTELPAESLSGATLQYLRAAGFHSASEIERFAKLSPESVPQYRHACETRLRSFARSVASDNQDYISSLGANQTIVFLIFTAEGIGFALWNPVSGFHLELGEQITINLDQVAIPPDMTPEEVISEAYGNRAYKYLNDSFFDQLVTDPNSPPDVQAIYWSCSENLAPILDEMCQSFAADSGLPFIKYAQPLGASIVRGLLYGNIEEKTETIPAVNLAWGITLQLYSLQEKQRQQQLIERRAVRRVASIYAVLPTALAFGLIIGLIFVNYWQSSSIESRNRAATAEKDRLQPFIAERNDEENTIAWLDDVMKQIAGLRAKQPAAISFAASLEPLYPSTGAFYVSDLKLSPGGAFEIKGLARDERAVSDFARQMEFALSQDGKNYYSGLSLEFKQGSKFTAKSGGAQTALGTLAPGVSAFLIKGAFLPASEIAVQTAGAPPLALPSPQNAPAPPQPQNISNGK